MKKHLQKYILSLCVSAFMIGALSIQANAQTDIPALWDRTSTTGAEGIPSWYSTSVRGIAYHNNKVYATTRADNSIRTMDALTGEDLTLDTPFDMTGVGGVGFYDVFDIETSTDGAIFVGNLTLDASGGHAFKVYIWESEGGTFDKTLTVTEAGRLGDKFTVVGSLADNTVEVWSITATIDPGKVYVSTTDDQGATWSTRTITLSGAGSDMNTNMGVSPLGIGGTSNIVTSGHGYTPRIFNSAGVSQGFFSDHIVSASGIKGFKIDGEEYAAFYAARSNGAADTRGNIQVYKLSTKTLVADTEVMGDASAFGSLYGEVAVRVNSDNSYDVFAADPQHGIAGYSSSEYVTITGTAGWRMLSSPTSDNSYDDLLGDLWTQGIGTGADATTGTASVQLYNTGTDNFAAATDLTANMTAGAGFITYVYSDDDYNASGADAGFPKTLSVSGTENTAPVVTTLNTEADAFTLVGNPFASTIDWDLLTPTDLAGTVYVYDHSSGYKAWNGTAGSLTDGLIAPFQGFWVQNAATITLPALSFTDGAKSTGGTFYKENANTASLKLVAEMDGLSNDAYFSFTETASIAKDNFDGLELSPIDHADYMSLSSKIGSELIDINNLPFDLSEIVEIPLQVSAFQKEDEGYSLKSGEVTLSWSAFSNVPEDWAITLNDYENGNTINLREQNSYVFDLKGSEDVVKAKTTFSVLSPISVVHEKSNDNSGLSITITPSETVSNEIDSKPIGFTLDQNYPNPFNPSTNIQYTLNTPGKVSLVVYNLMGQKVATLVNEIKTQGTHQVTWDASNIASGIYIYRLNAGGKMLTKQMTLIK